MRGSLEPVNDSPVTERLRLCDRGKILNSRSGMWLWCITTLCRLLRHSRQLRLISIRNKLFRARRGVSAANVIYMLQCGPNRHAQGDAVDDAPAEGGAFSSGWASMCSQRKPARKRYG